MMNKNLETMKMMLELTKAGFSKAEVLAACGISVSNIPEVACAEAIDIPEEIKPVKKTYSIEELMSLEEDPAVVKHNASLVPLGFICEDFKPKNGKKYRKGLKYNKYVANKAVWTYNHLMIKKNYPGIKYSDGYYYADDFSLFKTFASSYHVVENLTEEQFAVVKAYWDSKK